LALEESIQFSVNSKVLRCPDTTASMHYSITDVAMTSPKSTTSSLMKGRAKKKQLKT